MNMMLFFTVHAFAVLATVGGLYLYRRWLSEIGYDHPRIAYRPAYFLAPLFALMLAGGAVFGFLGQTGPALSLGISGLLGSCFLVELLFRFATGRLSDCHEMRRMMAEDL